MTEARPALDLTVLGELAASLRPAPPWTASQGYVYYDDGEPEPWDRTETLVAKCHGNHGTTNSHFIAAAAEAVPILVRLLERSRAETAKARSDAARLAEAAEEIAKGGGMKVSASEALLAGITLWEQSLRESVQVVGRPLQAAGAQVDRSEKPRA